MTILLPTWSIGNAQVCTGFRDAVIHHLQHDSTSKEFSMYFYGISLQGWQEIWPNIQIWLKRRPRRVANVYCSIDNFSSEPDALQKMARNLVGHVFVFQRGRAIFHPKAVVFYESRGTTCFIGSNNLTSAGLGWNFELATRMRLNRSDINAPRGLRDWETAVRRLCIPLTAELLNIYQEEFQAAQHLPRDRNPVGKRRIQHSQTASKAGLPIPQTAIVEVMPRETGTRGSQLQIPVDVARAFFKLPRGGQIQVNLVDAQSNQHSILTMTDYGNNTRRLAINRLTSEPRPCILWFRRKQTNYLFDIVSQTRNDLEFRRLLSLCIFQTSSVSKRWGMYE